MKYTCQIIEDERPAIKLLSAYIAKVPFLELQATNENAMEGLTAIKSSQPDLIFLDIQMPDFTGLDLLKMLKDPPQVILTTAYRDFAVEGFALNVTDYLVKPFSFERFMQAVNKVTEQIQVKNINQQKTAQEDQDHFFVRTNYKMEKIIFSDILYLESMREYVSIHTKERRYVVNQTMNNMESELPDTQFIRVHRSYLVSLSKVKTINGNMIVMDTKNIPIGPSYRNKFFDKIKLL